MMSRSLYVHRDGIALQKHVGCERHSLINVAAFVWFVNIAIYRAKATEWH